MTILYKLLLFALALAFIVFYPMLISIYVFLPLFIGVMGYIFLKGIEDNNILYMLIPFLYFLNLEANLSLPFFLILLATLIVYLLLFNSMKHIKHCKLCRQIISVILIDVIYLGLLLSYDYIFQVESIVVDKILLYSLVVDILMVAII